MRNLIRKNRADASLTLEASLVLPVFIMAVILLMNLFKLAAAEEEIFSGITEMAEDISLMGIINVSSENVADNIEDIIGEKLSGVIEGEFGEILKKELSGFVSSGMDAVFSEVELLLVNCASPLYFDDSLLKSLGVKEGVSGLSYTGSRIRDEDGYTDIICEYEVELAGPLFGTYSHKLINRVKLSSFFGITCESRFPESNRLSSEDNSGEDSEGETEDGEYVYVTERGRIYHKSIDCYHLKIHKKQVIFSEIPSLRNEYGEKYYACEHCTGKKNPGQNEVVFITTDGTRYHIDSLCSGLKRSVKKVKLSEAGNLRACRDCGY